MRYTVAVFFAALASTVSAQAGDWAQCGGVNWSGATACGPNAGCVKLNDYYSQCQPGATPAPAPASSQKPTTLITSTAKSTTTATPSTTGTPSGSTPAGTGPGTTLQSGYYWIRAVEAPNFHKYLQTSPLYSTGAALLGDYTTAGQFQVVDGQLVQLVSAPGEPVKLLYGVVSETRYINDNSLSVTFSTTKNTYGTFAWQGDGLTWTVAGLTRPNSAAWYVCAGQQLYINLGNYLYQTPAGCADETIHYYNDSKANN
ncbi:hypothetical protein EK21DRAFT_52660 [Setomelanomma holmii]|uniref:CBM1 domain-containing protein n=1 Tax=Setomelanomma holmii TaxID=210430 RepID=A0A9P4HMN1_9PLEO|nr:hypothetical protein EK21DRAFT_52660 [Setomelanomma holmii]